MQGELARSGKRRRPGPYLYAQKAGQKGGKEKLSKKILVISTSLRANSNSDMLAEALNQYIYTYCPDVIILGGGLAKGLAPWKTSLEGRLKAKVHFRQKTDICISSLMEDSGVLGAALLYGQTA